MKLKTINQVIAHHQCLGCGLCSSCDTIDMTCRNGIIIPNGVPRDSSLEKACPAKGYDLKLIGYKLFGSINYCHEIGYYRDIKLAHTNDNSLLIRASSGGIMAQIAISLLDKHLVDGVISNRFIYDDNKVRTETFIATSKEEIIEGQGSKYCPTSTLSILTQLDPTKKYLLIGTPCQIAGFRMYSEIHDCFKEMIPYTMANFCGGYRDFRELDFFVSNVAHISKVTSFRHRGGGQPGSMRIEGENGEVFQFPYPEYAKLSSFVKNERCTLCMDATGELADFSCGDAWLGKKEKNTPWSIVIARSEFAEKFINELYAEKFLTIDSNINCYEVIQSQKLNITSKKYRQYKRIKTRNILCLYSPDWHNNYWKKTGSYAGELRIYLSKAKAGILRRWKG